jgi:hypothetical protein
MDPVNVAKQYIEENMPHMADGNFSVNTHEPQHDLPFTDHIDGVDSSHLDIDQYHVVTVHKENKTEDDHVVNSFVKIKVGSDNNIKQVLLSKSSPF